MTVLLLLFTEVKDVNNCSILNASGSKVDSM